MDAANRSQVLNLARTLGYTPQLKPDGSDRLKKLIGLASDDGKPAIYVHKDAGQSKDSLALVFKVVVHPDRFIAPTTLNIDGVTQLRNRKNGVDLHRHSGYRGLAVNPAGGEPMGLAYAVEGIEAMAELLAGLKGTDRRAPDVSEPGRAPASTCSTPAPSSPAPQRAANESGRYPSRALIVDYPWVELLLDGTKTWEMRSTQISIRGRIGLIAKGTGTIVGEIDLVDCIGPLSPDELAAREANHQITAARKPASEWVERWNHAWIMAEPMRYPRPVPYDHPSGAVIWVNLGKEFGDYDARA